MDATGGGEDSRVATTGVLGLEVGLRLGLGEKTTAGMLTGLGLRFDGLLVGFGGWLGEGELGGRGLGGGGGGGLGGAGLGGNGGGGLGGGPREKHRMMRYGNGTQSICFCDC